MIRTNFSRYEFPELIDERNYKIAVEVGVNLGQFSYYLLKHSKLDLLISVDAYRGKYKSAMKGAATLLEPFALQGRSQLVRLTSVKAAEYHGDQNCDFDFVYIDAAHDEASVTQDIEAWMPLIRPGGIIAGHDYCEQHPGVIQAVNKFAKKTGWELYLTREAWASWFFEIPK